MGDCIQCVLASQGAGAPVGKEMDVSAAVIALQVMHFTLLQEFNQLLSGDSEDGGQGVDVEDMRRCGCCVVNVCLHKYPCFHGISS